MFTVLKNKKFWFAVALIVILTALANLTTGPGDKTTFLENVANSVMNPVNSFFSSLSNSSRNFVGSLLELKDLRKKNSDLEEQLEVLKKQLVYLRELELENSRLREMLNFKKKVSQFEMEIARVVGRDPGNWFETIVLDKGSKDEIAVNMAVVTDRGLVGKIQEVGETWSKALLIIDRRSAVSGMIQRTRDNGVIKGFSESVEKGLLKMEYLPPGANIIKGDMVISSGLGGVFPKGLVIGNVIKVNKEENELLKYAVIKPVVDFERLEEVFIIKASKDGISQEEEK